MWLQIVYRDGSNYDKSNSWSLAICINTDGTVNQLESDSPNSKFANHSQITIYTLFVIRKFVGIRE